MTPMMIQIRATSTSAPPLLCIGDVDDPDDDPDQGNQHVRAATALVAEAQDCPGCRDTEPHRSESEDDHRPGGGDRGAQLAVPIPLREPVALRVPVATAPVP